MIALGLDLSPIVIRISDEVRAVRFVGGAADLAQAMNGLNVRPSVFVLPAEDSASENPFGSQAVQHEINGRFDVLIAVEELTDPAGAAAHDAQLRPVRSAIATALLNWQPADDADGCEYVSGRITQFGPDSTLWWQDTYQSRYTIRSE